MSTLEGEKTLVQIAVRHLRSFGMRAPETAVILGSGLGQFSQKLHHSVTLPASEIPGYPTSSVPGHSGLIHFGTVSWNGTVSRPILLFQGRIHPYEGSSAFQSALNVKIAHAMGAKRLVITNAAGGIRTDLVPGSLMAHRGIMRLPVRSYDASDRQETKTITGGNHMSYSAMLNTILMGAAEECGVEVTSGVYCYVSGPSYETPAEVGMLRLIGADAVGMSTFPEVQEAKRLGLPTTAISLISNRASGLSAQLLTHAEVTKIAHGVAESVGALLSCAIVRLD